MLNNIYVMLNPLSLQNCIPKIILFNEKNNNVLINH